MYHGDKADHCTKDCPIYLDTKQKLDQELAQPLKQSPQTYQNSHTQTPAYYQSYHYTITNCPQPSQSPQITYPQSSLVPQITYPPAAPQITYPTPSNTNNHQVKK
jgi:hypothetical protein